MAKITKRERKDRETVVVRTKEKPTSGKASDWWNSGSKKELAEKLLGTVDFLKTQDMARVRQAGVYARLYGNMPLFGWAGSYASRMNTSQNLPSDRPTMSVITSCVDTIVSKISQSRPRPVFLTDKGDYKQRKFGKQLNSFSSGELYRTKAYDLGPLALRDACVLGTGAIKVLKTQDKKVGLERRLITELLVDRNDAFYGDPQCMYELKLIDREVLLSMFKDKPGMVESAQNAYPDQAPENGQTTSDLVMVAEAWRKPSAPGGDDGLHAIVCTEGVLLEEPWKKNRFPFVFFHYVPRLVGLWGQGLAERQMGTQMGINGLLQTIHSSINLVGVPRVFVEKGSKVVKAHLNNQVGAIVEYSGTKPSYEIAPCVPVELYSQLQRLIQYAYDQEGISELAAQSDKPKGLNSGVALREFNDIQSDRFAALQRRYDNAYIELTDQILDTACEISEEEGSYTTVFPNKDGTQEIDLPEIAKLKENTYVIQCFDSSSLPKDPAGRLQKVTEMMQAGLLSPQEGRRLLDYPDIEQVDQLENAGEERILQILDAIVDGGKYSPPDPFMDLMLAEKLVTQYYNLYEQSKLEESKAQKLRDFFSQIQTLKQAAMPAPQPGAPAPGAPAPIANPMAPPTSDLMSMAPEGVA